MKRKSFEIDFGYFIFEAEKANNIFFVGFCVFKIKGRCLCYIGYMSNKNSRTKVDVDIDFLFLKFKNILKSKYK